MTMEVCVHVESVLVREFVPLCLAFQLVVIVKNFLPVCLGFADGAEFCCRSAITVTCPAVFTEEVLSLAGISFAVFGDDHADANQ